MAASTPAPPRHPTIARSNCCDQDAGSVATLRPWSSSLKRAWMCVRQMRPPGRGDFWILKIAHAPSPKNLSKNGSAHKGGSLSVKACLRKNFLVRESNFAGGACVCLTLRLPDRGHPRTRLRGGAAGSTMAAFAKTGAEYLHLACAPSLAARATSLHPLLVAPLNSEAVPVGAEGP